MNDAIMIRKIHNLFKLAREDERYAQMIRQYNDLEEKYDYLVDGLPEEDEDIVRAFLCISEAMNYRMLEIICEKFEIDP